MAMIRGFRNETKGHGSRHGTEVDCLYFAFVDHSGQKVLQLSTLGSEHRQSQPKVSQTLQVTADTARDLVAIMTEAFSLGAAAAPALTPAETPSPEPVEDHGAPGDGAPISAFLTAAGVQLVEVVAADSAGRPQRVLARDPRPHVGGIWYVADLSQRDTLRFVDIDTLQRDAPAGVQRLVVLGTEWSEDLELVLRRSGIDLVRVADLDLGGGPEREQAADREPVAATEIDLAHETAAIDARVSWAALHTPSFPWIDQLLTSPTYHSQRALAGRAGVDEELVRAVLAALAGMGGRGEVAVVEQHAGLAPGTLRGSIPPLRRLLNVEGYETLVLVDHGTLVLDDTLLRHQFDVEGSLLPEGDLL